MSRRAIQKRRHRSDFEQYMQRRQAAMKAGFSSLTAFDLYMAALSKKQAQQTPQAAAPEPEHVHGPECSHDH